MAPARDVDSYIAQLEPPLRDLMKALQEVVREAVPGLVGPRRLRYTRAVRP